MILAIARKAMMTLLRDDWMAWPSVLTKKAKKDGKAELKQRTSGQPFVVARVRIQCVHRLK
jgi:hypothetical protein